MEMCGRLETYTAKIRLFHRTCVIGSEFSLEPRTASSSLCLETAFLTARRFWTLFLRLVKTRGVNAIP